ncbi:MAG TPA: tetratricopeptide repeat protein [Isosphaeraceae bacterium]|nr:tetratricopeptide repeat protein [Isosphaeraceae bacterium]
MGGTQGIAASARERREGAGGAPTPAAPGPEPGWRPWAERKAVRRALAVVLILVAGAGSYLAYDQYRLARLAGGVHRLLAAHRYDEAREPLQRWLRARPRSAEAHYYRAWLALVLNQGPEANREIGQATKLGLDPALLRPLIGIFHARSGHLHEAEPLLTEAFVEKREPQVEVARELARIYLTSYRIVEASVVIDRWRALAPEDPQAYLWTNEVESRFDAEPSMLIENYRAALERDPSLDQARLGLAEQLGKIRRFDEAEHEYRLYLDRHPNDATALVGLGRNASQSGDLEQASRYFEAALKLDPNRSDALKELTRADLRLGRLAQACQRFERLLQIEPYDHETHYSYAQVLKLKGQDARARAESELAERLRQEHDHIVQLRHNLKDPHDVASRYEVAQWLLTHGHGDEGLKWTQEILRTDPRHLPTHRLLADYYQKRGNPGLANYHRLIASSFSPEKG